MPNNNNSIDRLIIEAQPDPTVLLTLDFAAKVLRAISDAVPKNAQDRRAIQHYLDFAMLSLKASKREHQNIMP